MPLVSFCLSALANPPAGRLFAEISAFCFPDFCFSSPAYVKERRVASAKRPNYPPSPRLRPLPKATSNIAYEPCSVQKYFKKISPHPGIAAQLIFPPLFAPCPTVTCIVQFCSADHSPKCSNTTILSIDRFMDLFRSQSDPTMVAVGLQPTETRTTRIRRRGAAPDHT